MLFSILIANYNNSGFLVTALDSIFIQEYTNWEIIIVDDHSTDGFLEIIRPYAADSRVKIFINDRNYGCGYTKRKCAKEASGEILAFVDPDDRIQPGALKIMAEAHSQKNNCSIIHSTHFVCNESLEVKRVAEYVREIPENSSYLLLNDGRIHHFATFKKSFYNQTEGISEKNKKAVDQDLYYKLEDVGNIHFVNIPLYHYRIHPGGISTSGKEAEATLWHYSIIEEACQRRMRILKSQSPTPSSLIKKYRTRYYKIRIFHSFRKRNWLRLIGSAIMFPLAGGMGNLISYLRKFPKEGLSLLKKSFVTNYEIK